MDGERMVGWEEAAAATAFETSPFSCFFFSLGPSTFVMPTALMKKKKINIYLTYSRKSSSSPTYISSL